jgi:hypothetical protein
MVDDGGDVLTLTKVVEMLDIATLHFPWLESLQIQYQKDQNHDVQKLDLLFSFKTQT